MTRGRCPRSAGEPLRFAFDGDAHASMEHLWDALDAENRIALYVESTDLKVRFANPAAVLPTGFSDRRFAGDAFFATHALFATVE